MKNSQTGHQRGMGGRETEDDDTRERHTDTHKLTRHTARDVNHYKKHSAPPPSQWCLRVSDTPGCMHSHKRSSNVRKRPSGPERSRAVPSGPRAVPSGPRAPQSLLTARSLFLVMINIPAGLPHIPSGRTHHSGPRPPCRRDARYEFCQLCLRERVVRLRSESVSVRPPEAKILNY